MAGFIPLLIPLNSEAGAAYAVTQHAANNAARIAAESEARIWNADSSYASKARIYDAQQRICTNGRCGPLKFCVWQQWDLGVPCTQAAFATQMFQIDRFLWAQTALRNLLAAMPDRDLPTTFTEQNVIAGAAKVRAKSRAWAQWCVDVTRVAHLYRWASNLRWTYASDRIDVRRAAMARAAYDYENAPGAVNQIIGVTGQHGLLERAAVEHLNATSILRMRSDFDALRWGRTIADGVERPASDAPYATTTELGARQPAIPTSKAAFEPEIESHQIYGLRNLMFAGISTLDQLATYFAFTPRRIPAAGWGRGNRDSILQNTIGRNHGSFHFSESGKSGAALISRITARDGDQSANLWWIFPPITTGAAGTGEAYIAPGDMTHSSRQGRSAASPFLTVRSCITMAQDLVAVGYGDVLSAGIDGWIAQVERLPENLRPMNSAQGAELSRAVARAGVNEAVAIYSSTAGAITGIVTAINPIAGVVVGLVLAIGGLVMQFSIELGIVHPTPPPCPAPPFLRVINPGSGELCDFSGEGESNRGHLASRAIIVRDMAKLGLRPEQWFDAIAAAENAPVAPPPLPPLAAQLKNPAIAVAALSAGLLGTKFFFTGGI